MPTPVGHILGSLAAYEGAKHTILRESKIPRYLTWFVVVCALMPDIDHIAQVISPRLEEYMHGPTHSLVGCSLLAFAIALVLKMLNVSLSFRKAFLLFALCAFMHPLQDFLMGIGPPVQFLWPMSTRGWLSPVPLQPTSYYAHSLGGFAALLWHPPTLKAIAFELAAFLPLIMIWQVKSIKQRLLLGATVVSIFAAIYFTYQPFKKYWDMKGATRQKQMIEQRVEKARESNQRIDADSE